MLRFMLLVLGTLPRTSEAQVLYGSLTGNVTDLTGSAVPGAKVEALNGATGSSKQTTNDDCGGYLIADLQPGVYKVTISAPAFGAIEQDNVQVDGNTVRRVDAQLQLAQVNQNVTVDASSVTLQTDRADVSSQIQSSQVENLPLGANRNFQTLYKLIPGSSPPIAAHSSAGNPTGALATDVNGGADTSNSTRIDGSSILNFWEGNIIAYVPPADRW